jgi:hypothetical protein
LWLIDIQTKSNKKLAALFAICLINMRQSQIEKTMNLNMSCQTILTRLFTTHASDKNDHDTFLKDIFEMVNFSFHFISTLSLFHFELIWVFYLNYSCRKSISFLASWQCTWPRSMTMRPNKYLHCKWN